MKRIFSILFALALVLGFSLVATTPVAAATPIYVNASRPDDTGAGTSWATAKKYVQSGVNIVDAGGIVYVAAGTYNEAYANWVDIEINKNLSLIGAGSALTIVKLREYNNPVGTHIDGVRIDADTVTITGMTFTKQDSATYASGHCIRAVQAIGGYPAAGSTISITLDDVVTEYAADMNILFEGNFKFDPVTLTNVTSRNCLIGPGLWSGWGLYVNPSSYPIDNFTVTNSHFDNNKGDGFRIARLNNRLTISGGSFKDNQFSGINNDYSFNASVIGVNADNNDKNANGWNGGIRFWNSSNVTIMDSSANNCGKRGIQIAAFDGGTSDNVLIRNVTIDGAGQRGIQIAAGGGATVSNITIEDSLIQHSVGNNIHFMTGDWPPGTLGTITGTNLIRNCSIFDAGNSGIWVGKIENPGVVSTIEGIEAVCNSFSGNAVWGLVNNTASSVDARYNWWGDASGPKGAGSGSGDAVSTNVNFDPWIGKPASVPTKTGTGTASFNTSRGCVRELVAVATPPSPPVALPHGMFSFNCSCIDPGDTVTLTVTLPANVPIGTKWWKYQNGSWYSLPIGSDNGDKIITVTLTDRTPTDPGLGDEDPTGGRIMDDGGLGAGAAVGWETYPVSRVRVLLPWIALFAAIMAGVSLLVLRNRRTTT